jgi:hypothetical protein
MLKFSGTQIAAIFRFYSSVFKKIQAFKSLLFVDLIHTEKFYPGKSLLNKNISISLLKFNAKTILVMNIFRHFIR